MLQSEPETGRGLDRPTPPSASWIKTRTQIFATIRAIAVTRFADTTVKASQAKAETRSRATGRSSFQWDRDISSEQRPLVEPVGGHEIARTEAADRKPLSKRDKGPGQRHGRMPVIAVIRSTNGGRPRGSSFLTVDGVVG